jgi:hypothetical protein
MLLLRGRSRRKVEPCINISTWSHLRVSRVRGNYLERYSERRPSRSPVGCLRRGVEGCNCSEELLREDRRDRSTSRLAAEGGSGDGNSAIAEAVVGLDRSNPAKEEGQDEVVAGRRTGDDRTSRSGGSTNKRPPRPVGCLMCLMDLVLLLLLLLLRDRGSASTRGH